MRPSLFYTWEKLGQATHALVSGEGDIKTRLEAAAISLSPLSESLVPEQFREEYNAIWAELTNREALEGEGTIKATIRELTPHECSKLATRIFNFYVTVAQTEEPQESI